MVDIKWRKQYQGCAHIVWRKEEAPDSSVLEPLAGLLIHDDNVTGVAQLQVKVHGEKYLCVLVQARAATYCAATAKKICYSFGHKHLDYALTECGLEDVQYGTSKVIRNEFNSNFHKAKVLQGTVEPRTRGQTKEAKAAAVADGDDNGSGAEKRAADSNVNSRKRKRRKKQRLAEGSDPELDGDLNAAKLGAYAKDLRCEPTAAAVVDALHERIKFLSNVACQPVLTLGKSLGLDLSAHVSATFLATGALWSMELTLAELQCACAGRSGACTARAARQILCTRGQ